LREEINHKRQRYVRKVRRREGVKKALDVDPGKKEDEKPHANQDFHQQDKSWFNFLHP
jgi:hypothetical protein